MTNLPDDVDQLKAMLRQLQAYFNFVNKNYYGSSVQLIHD
jgi:hypothetical protein